MTFVAPALAGAQTCALAPVFQNAMVFQQGVALPVWGTAASGAAITVTFAEQRKATTADAQGVWRVALDALPASANAQELKVAAGDEQLVLQDILVGEVWLAAGQSNMEWPLAGEAHARTELPQANLPQLRLLHLAYAGQGYDAEAFDPEVVQRLTPQKFFRGAWTACTPRSAKNFSAVAYYFGKELQQVVKTPVGVIDLAVGGSPTEAWIRREALAADESLRPLVQGDWLTNEKLGDWCRQRGRENLAAALQQGELPHDELGPNHPFKPGFLWEAGIARRMPLPVRGVIWYQGESNSLELRRVRQHERLFPLLVSDWRKQWGIGEFPFLYCQLSSIGTEKGYRSQHWPEFRDSQRRMLAEIPHTGMAVTSDLGHRSDVHPRNKKEVGHRLALWALAQTYGKQVACSGPLAASMRRDGAALIVKFDHCEAGLKTSDGQPAAGFEIAGDDGMFRTAEVEIGQETVTLTSPQITQPAAARYGWQPNCIGNLTNGANLPASTFLLPPPRK
jgi:sialate O-acetylesterase